MNSLFKLVSCLYFCAYVFASAPPKAPELSKDIKEDWKRFFSNPTKNDELATRSDVAQKEQIDNYFLNPLPEYEAFNKWFYKALDNGRKSIYEQIRKSYEDPNFVPQKTLTNTPFPIPVQFQRVYSWLLTQNPSLTDPAQKEIVKNDEEYKKKVDSFFGGTIKPIFDRFYQWFYDRQAEDTDWKQHLEDTKKLSSPRFRALASTPFPVPKKYHVYYYYEMLHPNHTITRHNYSISTNDSNEGNIKQIVNDFFGGTVKPEFEDFYQWFYDKQQNDDQWLKELNLAQHFNYPEVDDKAYVTPFPIPAKYRPYYILSEVLYPNKSSGDSLQSVTTESAKQLQKNEPFDADLVNDFFGGTVDPFFGDFYNWFYGKQQDDDNWQRQLDLAQGLNLTDFDLASTPFPVPEEYHPFYLFANVLSPPENGSGFALATDLDKLLDDANKLQNFPEFNKWLNETSPFQKNLLKKACELTLQPSKISNMSTPFPVPEPLRDAFCWAIFHDDADNLTSEGDIFYRNELEKFFKKPHLPIHDLFYQWLYDVETDDERAKARQATDQPIKLDFAKWMRFTPFPVPAEHLHNFAFINAVESILNITTKSPEDSAKAISGGTEAEPDIPGTKSYLEFTQWINKVLNNDQQLLADKVKECQHDLKFNLREISTSTPFPVPLNHFRFYHWLNAHLDDLKKTTTSRSPSAQSPGSNSGNKYPEFVQWLNKLFHHNQAEIAQQVRECQADVTFQPRNIRVTPPFAVPLNYYRFYHWVNSKLHPQDYVTLEPTNTPKPFVYEETHTTSTDETPHPTESYHEFSAWLNKVFNNDPKLIEQKKKECQHDQEFQYRSISDRTTPFPIPIKDFRFYHWLLHRIKSGKLEESVPTQAHPNPPSTIAERYINPYPEFHYWLNRIYKNNLTLIYEKLNECRQDKTFIPNPDRATVPFPVPLRFYRLYFWLNDKLKSGAITTSANDPYRPPKTEPEPREYDEDESRPPTTPSYHEFTNWLNEVLDHKQDLIDQKIKECQHDREFKPRDIKESPPFPVPLRFYRFYHWLNAKVKAGEHKKAGIIHTPPARSHATTGKPGVSFMSTQAFPEYTQWLFDMFKNDQKLINEKLIECQQDPTFNPRAIKVTAPFPVPIRHYRLYHWINSKLNPAAYKYSPNEITHPPPISFDETDAPVTELDESETTTPTETTTDPPLPTTKSYMEFTKWLNEILDDNAELIKQKMLECQHDRDFNPREIKQTAPFPVPINHFRFYHWLNAKYKAGEHKKQGIIHTAPAKRHATTGKPGVSFMSTRSYPEYTQWLFNQFKNDQKLIKEKLNECQKDQTFNPRDINNSTTPFPIPIRHFRFFHWMNSKLKSQQPSA